MLDIVSSVQQFAPTLFSIDNSKLMESRRVALEEIDKQNLAAQNAASQLSSAIGALDFHESEQPYKAELVNQYDNMVNGALEKYGTLRFAMNDSMAKSRELSTSPDVLGRIKTNEQYKEWEKNRNHLSSGCEIWMLWMSRTRRWTAGQNWRNVTRI